MKRIVLLITSALLALTVVGGTAALGAPKATPKESSEVIEVTPADELPKNPELRKALKRSLKRGGSYQQATINSSGDVVPIPKNAYTAQGGCRISIFVGKPYKRFGRIRYVTKVTIRSCGKRILANGYLKNTSGFYKPTLDRWGRYVTDGNGSIARYGSGKCQKGREQYMNVLSNPVYQRSFAWLRC